MFIMISLFFFFFLNDTAPTEIYTFPLHDPLPIYDTLDPAGLPEDKTVWNSPPIPFVLWLHEKMSGQPVKAKGIGGESNYAGKRPPAEIKDDEIGRAHV